MIRHFVAAMLAATVSLTASVARAQDPESNDPRYQFNKLDDGYVRLDLKTGQVALCSRRTVGWSCLAVPDDRAAFDSEIARLQGENAALKKALLDHGIPLPGTVKPESPIARNDTPPARTPEPELKLPSNADIDRMMAVVERMWRRLVEIINNLQKDMKDKT